MLVMIDFGVERVLISALDMAQALRATWMNMIYKYDEDQERAVESFREDLTDQPTEEALRAHTQSCRDFGYKWTPLSIKDTKVLTEEQYETLSTIGNYRIIN